MTVKETSLDSFVKLEKEKLDQRVYAALVDGSIPDPMGVCKDGWAICTRRELAEYMKEQASTVSGAVNRLIKQGFVKVNGKIKCQITGRMVECIQKWGD